jgi:hypothetical protein
MEEREVTLALKAFLSRKGWKIMSVHYPGAQGGLSVSMDGKTRGIVPDLIAMKDDVILIVESKSSFSSSDVNKLNNVFRDSRFFEKLRKKLCLPSGLLYQKAIAFHSFDFEIRDIPSGFVVFVVKGEKEVMVFVDKSVDSIARTILNPNFIS